jgi:hypothetical protein
VRGRWRLRLSLPSGSRWQLKTKKITQMKFKVILLSSEEEKEWLLAL